GMQAEVAFRPVGEEIRMRGVVVRAERSAFSLAEGISRGIYIRTTPGDQTQYLLEGERIYNPSHHGGLLSTFDEVALNGIESRPGGIPPSYGGRIGGVL